MMKIDSSSDEKVGQINGFKLLLSAWLQSTIRIVNYYPDIRIIRISVSALVQTWGHQVHEYFYLSTDLKVLVLYLNTFLISPMYLYLYSSTLLMTCMYLSI